MDLAMEKKGWTLVWSEEFDGDEIDRCIWNFENGYIRNNELQYYCDRLENAKIEDSKLILEARKDHVYEGYEYTSASINTFGKKSFQYGRVEMCAKLPHGKGIWPAFWMMGDTYGEVGWPFCGEIDIMELIGGGESGDATVYTTLHWDNIGHQQEGSMTTLESGTFAENYHIFGIEWNKEEICWYIDDNIFYRLNITGRDKASFHQKHWILLNLAVGGNWPGSPDETTMFPQKYCIDWVRVYQKTVI